MTVALAIEAPDASITRPVIPALLSWAKALHVYIRPATTIVSSSAFIDPLLTN
jgi:hypothetical protein